MEPIKFNNNDKLPKEALIPYKLKRKNIDMEEHASQFRETASDEIRQKLIAYDKFMSTHDFNGRLLSPEQAVDEFLKQK